MNHGFHRFSRMAGMMVGMAIASGGLGPVPVLGRFEGWGLQASASDSSLFNPPLAIEEVTAIAKDMTVFIAGPTSGSGAIVHRQGNVYTVLTTKTVVSGSGPYQVVTSNGRRYSVSPSGVIMLPLVDLAVLQFTSSETYPVAQLAEPSDSQIYLTVATQPQTTLFAAGNLVSTAGMNLSDGYDLLYNSALQSAGSGGPVVDRWGRLIGIQGRFNPESVTASSAIAVSNFLRLAPTVGLNLGWRGSLLSNMIQPATQPRAIALSPDGSLLATDGGYNQIQLWDWQSSQLIYTLSGHNSEVNSLAISPNKQILVSGDQQGQAIIWNLRTGQIANTITRSPSNPITSVAITGNGQTLITGSNQGIELWDINTGRLVLTLPESGEANAIAISPDSRTLVSGHLDNTVKVWNLLNGNLVHTLEAGEPGFIVESVAISPDGQTIAGGTYREIRLWNRERGIRQRTIVAHCDLCYVYDLAFTPEGEAIVSTSEDGTKIWNIAEGTLLRTIDGSAKTLALSGDRTLILGGDTLRIWQVP
ncbi:trypsin-like peptidase domain-containing protein [Laspinema olomoucense]|uniref:trypsin-like peptidase domain-containing protein n=1 Tax=Laspinema olomoucense TaxID=3231600 RepID=UPI0021BA7586|nr:trypsin-like peptidase domain-containing protein [Laspinema sp. D3d]MCT7972519.1 trypsin-like peptidase domain-containing protein [Laspinema sp. D3d]